MNIQRFYLAVAAPLLLLLTWQVVAHQSAIVWIAIGLLMGYGSRIAYGCNIGAFLSGVSSTSLHGWLWIAAALPGNWVGIKLRGVFRVE